MRDLSEPVVLQCFDSDKWLDIVLGPGFWIWYADKSELALTLGRYTPPSRGVYNGGNISVAGGYVLVSPHSKNRLEFDKQILPLGHAVYCVEEDWVYVGDGETPGGVKVPGAREVDRRVTAESRA